VIPPGNLRPYTHLVNLVAKRSSLLLVGGAAGSQEYMRWVRSLEQDFGVRIEVQTIMGPDNRPSAIGGTISPISSAEPGPVVRGGETVPTDCQLAFTVDGHETRCAVRYC